MYVSQLEGDYSWIGELSQGIANTVQSVTGYGAVGNPPPPDQKQEFPWVPVIAIGGGTVVLLALALKGKGKRRR